MRARTKLLKLREERGAPQAPSMKKQLRIKKTRELGHIGPRAETTMLQRRMRSTANTRQRNEINLKAPVKARKKAEDQRVEIKLRSTKVMTGEVGQEAKTVVFKRKKRNQNLITAKIEISVMSQRKSIMRTLKEMERGLGQSQIVKKEQLQKMDADQVAETGTEERLQRQKTKKKNETKTRRGPGSVAGATKDGATVTGRVRGGDRPGIRNTEQGVQTEVRPETRTEAGAPEVRVTKETTAKTDHLIERKKTEKPAAKGEDVAAALIATGMRKGRVRGAQTPKEELIVPLNPKTEGVQPDQDQIVQKAKTKTIARGKNPAPAPALTATEPVMLS